MSQTWFLAPGTRKQRQAKLRATEKSTFQLGSQAASNRHHSRSEGNEHSRQGETEQSGREIKTIFRIKSPGQRYRNQPHMSLG